MLFLLSFYAVFVLKMIDFCKVRNIFAEFDADEDQKLRFDEFAELCETRSSTQLRGDDVQELFNTYDCTQSAAASSGACFSIVLCCFLSFYAVFLSFYAVFVLKMMYLQDDTLAVAEWLEGMGFAEYSEAFVSQGFETLASLRGAGLTDADLRDIGIHKLRHRKAILNLISQEGYVGPQDLKRLFLKAQQSKINREQLQLIKHGACFSIVLCCFVLNMIDLQGELERWLPAEEQYRPSSGNSRWKRCYVTLWLAGASAF